MSHLLSLILFTPVVGAGIVALLPKEQRLAIKWVSLISSLIPLFLCVPLLANFDYAQAHRIQFVEKHLWIEALTVYYYLGVDGLSLPMVGLTCLLTTLSLIYSWTIEERPKEYFALFLLLETGMLGVFMALDFFLFYIFWEVSLVPMYFIIGVWGGPRREYAAIKFFLYTLVGGVAMLLAIIYLYLQHHTFDMIQLQQIQPFSTPSLARTLVFWAFFLSFAIKVPVFPFHTWLPDAHVEAPTAGSVILAGILLKLGVYGFLRVILPIFPQASQQFALPMAVLALIGIVYGALVAMAQWDFKKLIAYSSVNHMGFVMLGIAAAATQWNPSLPSQNILLIKSSALNGAQYEMFSHGVITGALFMLVGVLYDRAHIRDLGAFGGLANVMKLYYGFFTTFALGSLGLPGLSTFISEFLTLTGSFPILPVIAGLSIIGIVVTAAFFLWTIQRIFLGPLNEKWAHLSDMDTRERISLTPLLVMMVLFGIFPKPLLACFNPVSQFIVKLFLPGG